MFVSKLLLQLARQETHIDSKDGAGWGGRKEQSVTTTIMPRANELRFAEKMQFRFFLETSIGNIVSKHGVFSTAK